MFDSIDKDGNGKLTRRELKNGLKSSDVVMEAIGCKRLKDGMVGGTGQGYEAGVGVELGR